MSNIPQNITREHLLQAIHKIDEEGVPVKARSSTYDVSYQGQTYPPKLVVSWANVYANGAELDRSTFEGGNNTDCFNLLERENFLIIEKADNSALNQLWDEFLKDWPLSRLKEMTLAEYTGINDKNTFCYWVEARLQELGSIWGGSSFKFGIYRRGDGSTKSENSRYSYSENYAWETRFGTSETEAFATVKDHIIKIIESIQADKMEVIDEAPFWPVFKWKIAFLYQDRDNPLLVAVYKEKNLRAFWDNRSFPKQTRYYDLHKAVIAERNDTDILTFSRHVWTKAERNLEKMAFLPNDALEILKDRYESIGNGTEKVIGFLNNSKKTIALSLEGKSVRLTMEPWKPSTKNVKIKQRYGPDDSRNSNFDSQAPSVAKGYEAILVECSKLSAFETLLDEYEDAEAENVEQLAMNESGEKGNHQQPLNQILYGPPGTGKTYHTVNRALEIVDPEFYELYKTDRNVLNTRFRELAAEGTIGFVTFHQSFSYEDFVEGLRANASDGNISYDVEDGIFKLLCQSEDLLIEDGKMEGVNIAGRQIWKMSLGNTLGSDSYIFDNCIEANEIRLGYGENTDFSDCSNRDAIFKKMQISYPEIKIADYGITAVDLFVNKMNKGDLVIISDGNLKFRAIAEITGDYECSPEADFGHYGQVRKTVWHKVYTKSLPYQRIMDKKFSQMTIYKLKPKALNLDKLQSVLEATGERIGHTGLVAGKSLKDGKYSIENVSGETIRVRSARTGSTIPIDWQLLEELAALVREGKLSVEDIAKKRVFEKTDSTLEKYLVNGYPGILSEVVSVMLEDVGESEPSNPKSKARVLIIDEINRGNISSIFGELITLIEPSKRSGANEALSVTLPYSKEVFQVPDNLYLIGTMNTADRSLALMDTALRRRFDFVEMMPDTSRLERIVVKGILISQMLSKINKRIEALYDREHSVGHAFFMPLETEGDEEKKFQLLQRIFSNSILPLLEEYFFEDWAKIRLVLGDDNKDLENQFIIENSVDDGALFGKDAQLDYVVEERRSYCRNETALKSPASYVGIYEN